MNTQIETNLGFMRALRRIYYKRFCLPRKLKSAVRSFQTRYGYGIPTINGVFMDELVTQPINWHDEDL